MLVLDPMEIENPFGQGTLEHRLLSRAWRRRYLGSGQPMGLGPDRVDPNIWVDGPLERQHDSTGVVICRGDVLCISTSTRRLVLESLAAAAKQSSR